MASHGHVATTQTSPAGRSQWVEITDSGRRALADAEAVWRRVQTAVEEQIGAEGAQTLDRWIAALAPLA